LVKGKGKRIAEGCIPFPPAKTHYPFAGASAIEIQNGGLKGLV